MNEMFNHTEVDIFFFDKYWLGCDNDRALIAESRDPIMQPHSSSALMITEHVKLNKINRVQRN